MIKRYLLLTIVIDELIDSYKLFEGLNIINSLDEDYIKSCVSDYALDICVKNNINYFETTIVYKVLKELESHKTLEDYNNDANFIEGILSSIKRKIFITKG